MSSIKNWIALYRLKVKAWREGISLPGRHLVKTDREYMRLLMKIAEYEKKGKESIMGE